MVTCTQAALERTILCKNRCAICFLALSVRRVKHQWHVKRETIYPPAQQLQKTNWQRSTMLFMGKLTINYKWPFSSSQTVSHYQRV